jgi:hypothetical protein
MNTNPSVITRVERAFVSNVPSAPLANASVVLFATHPCTLGGASYVSRFATPSGGAIAVAPEAMETVRIIYALHNHASAANGLCAYQTLDGGATWIETDIKDGSNAATIGAAAPVQIPALSSGQEWSEIFHIGAYKGIAIVHTAGTTGPTAVTGWAIAISVQYSPQEN